MGFFWRLGTARALCPDMYDPNLAEEFRNRSKQFALDVDTLCALLPKDERSQEIATQLHAAAYSAAMNYRAACRARSDSEFISKICITVDEADESVGWLEVLKESRRATGAELEKLLREGTELLKVFAASKRTAIRNKAKRRKTRR